MSGDQAQDQQQNNGRRTPPGRPFPPGVSGNPGGRPKGSISLTAMLRAKLAENGGKVANEIIEAVVKNVDNPQIAKLLFDRHDGLLTQRLQISENMANQTSLFMQAMARVEEITPAIAEKVLKEYTAVLREFASDAMEEDGGEEDSEE